MILGPRTSHLGYRYWSSASSFSPSKSWGITRQHESSTISPYIQPSMAVYIVDLIKIWINSLSRLRYRNAMICRVLNLWLRAHNSRRILTSLDTSTVPQEMLLCQGSYASLIDIVSIVSLTTNCQGCQSFSQRNKRYPTRVRNHSETCLRRTSRES